MAEKRVTMSDMAEKLGISINAVSLALNDRVGVSEETRKKVLKLAEEIGYLDQNEKYTVAYATKNICLMLEHRFFRDMHFYGRMLLGAESAAREAGYDLLVNSFAQNSEMIPACVENRKVSGIIVLGKIKDNHLTKLKSYGIPVVLVDHISLKETTDCIVTDNKSGTYKLTKYLIDQGFRKIGYFGGIEYSPSVRERFWGYQEALQDFLGFDSFEKSIEYAERYSMLNGIEKYVIENDLEAMGKAFQSIKEKPESLICSNDRLAIMLCQVLDNMGYQVPEDISIVGFDDIEMSKIVTPQITTVHVYKSAMGRKGVQRLIYRMEHPKDEIEKVVMDVQIVERNSVKKVRCDI